MCRTEEWRNFEVSEPKRTAPLSRKKERIPKQNTITQGVDIESLFRHIKYQNRDQSNRLRGEIEP